MHCIYIGVYLRRAFIFILIAALGCLISCAETVHINPGQMTKNQVLQLQSSLEREGFKYRMWNSKHPYPDLDNLLIYYPQKNSTRQLDKIVSILQTLNITVDNIVAEKVQKHEFTKGNYGLYMRSDEPKAKKINISEMDFDVKFTDVEFDSFECDTLLELNSGNAARFVSISKNEESVAGSSWASQRNNNKDLLVNRNAK